MVARAHEVSVEITCEENFKVATQMPIHADGNVSSLMGSFALK